jgi:plasmid maintenance system antidote protein VapI
MELMKAKKESETVDRLKDELFSVIEVTMEKEGVSQGEVARRLGAQRTNINLAIRGRIPVTLDFLVKMAESLGLKVSLKASK